VSRLDVVTSGVLVLPTTPAAYEHLKQSFSCRTVQKTYIALVHGLAPVDGTIDARLRVVSSVSTRKTFVHPHGKEARTDFRRLGVYQLPVSETPPGCGPSTVIPVVLSPGGQAATFAAAATREQTEHRPLLQPNEHLFSLMEVYPHTGRTHQIRAHLASINHPLVRDVKYFSQRWQTVARRRDDRTWCPRVFLHASRLRLPADLDGVAVDVQAALTPELEVILASLVEVAA